VASAELAAERVVAAGGALMVKPRGIPVGRVVVVADPFGNGLVSKGRYQTGHPRTG
jgi:predicted enzyme related to lactoylglutathione lyase